MVLSVSLHEHELSFGDLAWPSACVGKQCSRGDSMCQASTITDDWVTKGCHIHVDGVELNVFTNHRAEIGFRAVFSSTSAGRLNQAIRTASTVCLADPETRRAWIEKLESARAYMLGIRGELADLARGRMLEFKFLRIAIQRWGDEHGNA
jgi:hypothetical protein